MYTIKLALSACKCMGRMLLEELLYIYIYFDNKCTIIKGIEQNQLVKMALV